jgi:hypothetical protein
VPALLLAPYAQQTGVALPAPWKQWKYSAPVRVPALHESRLVRVRVPEAVSREALPGWADLRMIDDAGREVPFVLHARTEQFSRELRQARLMDLTYKPGEDTRATVDLGAQAPVHNGIEIQTPLQELFARVAIDVSANAKNWRVLQEGAPIFRFVKSGLDGNQTVHYTDNTWRYLRLRITDGPEKFPLTGVRVWHEVKQEAEMVPVETNLRPDPAAPPGESWWVADAGPAGQLASQVAFSVKPGAFHRPVRIRTSDDGTTWRTAGSGDIYRMEAGEGVREQLRVGFAESRSRFLRVEIVNRNDAPLAGAALTVYATPRRVVFRAEPGRSYRLLYGNLRAVGAQYEMAQVTPAAALEAAAPSELGPGVANAGYVDPAPWTERHSAVLWAALIAALAVLGLLALRALQSSAAQDT